MKINQKYTKALGGRGFALDPLEELTALTQAP